MPQSVNTGITETGNGQDLYLPASGGELFGDLVVNGSVAVTRGLLVGLNSTVSGDLSVGNIIDTTGLLVRNNAQVDNYLTVGIDAQISRDLNVTRNATVSGNVVLGAIDKNIFVDGGLKTRNLGYVNLQAGDPLTNGTYEIPFLVPTGVITERTLTGNKAFCQIEPNGTLYAVVSTKNPAVVLNSFLDGATDNLSGIRINTNLGGNQYRFRLVNTSTIVPAQVQISWF